MYECVYVCSCLLCVVIVVCVIDIVDVVVNVYSKVVCVFLWMSVSYALYVV